MADVTKNFDKYVVSYNSGSESSWAAIQCYNASTLVGIIGFYPDGKSAPVNSYSGGFITLYYAASRFSDVMLILLHERPLSLHLNTSTLHGMLYGYQEPIGEEEL